MNNCTAKWIKRDDVDAIAPSFDELLKETARAYCEYFHNNNRGPLASNNLETLDAAMIDRYGVFIQVRKMGTPEAALVVYGSRAAWYNNLEPFAVVPFCSCNCEGGLIQ